MRIYSRILPLLITGLAIAGGVIFAHPASAAVPVAVVQFDSSTNFELSLEYFLSDLLDSVEVKRAESTAAYELLKIEKAREDVNKLTQEVQEELTDYGLILTGVSDPRLSKNPACLANPGQCDDPDTKVTIDPFKDSRIIHNVYDYIFEEPREKARVFTMCYFNMLIWDQADYIEQLFNDPDINITARIWKPPAGLCEQGKGTTTKCSYGQSTVQSINLLRFKRDALLYLLKRTNQYQLDYPQIFLFGDWAGYADVNDPKYQRYGLSLRGESDEARFRKQSFQNCVPVIASSTGTPPVVPDPGLSFHNVTLNEVANFLPTLGKSAIDRNDATWEELRIAKQDRNTINGVVRTAWAWIDQILSETTRERELTYLAGQGIRPERLYLSVEGENPNDTPGNPNTIPLKYQYDTGYIISPAVVLLQKMQAANQAMFDLAQKSFLYLDPRLTPPDILARYGVASNTENCYDDTGLPTGCSPEEQDQLYKRQICNFPGTVGEATACRFLEPWLRPTRAFRSAPDARVVGRGNNTNRVEAGLPAPWEDEMSYIALGNEKLGRQELLQDGTADTAYTVAKYRLVGTTHDNIASKVLGTDYAINDWYDRVFEMYEPDRDRALTDDGGLQFNLTDWQCYLATWFFPSGSVFPDGTYAARRTAPYQELGLPDIFLSPFGREYTDPDDAGPIDILQHALSRNMGVVGLGADPYAYCQARLNSGSY